VASGHSVELAPARWQELFDQMMRRVAGRFARVDLRRRATAFVRGLLADLPRKNCWTIAEHAGDASPDGMQHLLARAVWDADALRDDVRAVLVDYLGDPAAVLVIDETGDLKRAATPSGCNASTPVPPARSTTPRSPSTLPMPPRPGTG
jgi:SRSO17 transposase